MCITEEEATCTTDDSGAAAVGIVGAVMTGFGVIEIIAEMTTVGIVVMTIGIAIIGIAAWMITRKM